MDFDYSELTGLAELSRDRNIVGKALLSEFIGTLILVFVGCGSCINWGTGTPPSTVEIALAFGLTVAAMVQATGHISGGHLNPAITAGQLVAGKIKPIKAVLYIIFQCVGGIAGAAILKALLPGELLSNPEFNNNLGMTIPNQKLDVGVGQAFVVELVITFVLVLVVFGATDGFRSDVKGSAPLAIGLAISACHLAAIRFTGASMNPARTFGPAVIMGIWTDHWIYWVGPIAGGALAGILYQIAFKASTTSEDTGRESQECSTRDTKEITRLIGLETANLERYVTPHSSTYGTVGVASRR